MTSKQCFKCKKTLPLDMFYKHPQMPDGRVNKCKECNKKDVRDNREKNIDYYLEYDRSRANLPKRVLAREIYAQTDLGKKAASRSGLKWTKHNLLKKSASTIVGNAVRDGKLQKPSFCSECGKNSGRIHGHHDDYAYPMIVRWLCSKCHCAWHKINGSAING